jgi:hypothetical protein
VRPRPIAAHDVRGWDVPTVGVFPGSFNPPTVAHLAIAEAALRAHRLERILLSVSHTALAKEHVDHPRFEDRIAVLEESVSHAERIGVRVTEHQLLADIADGFDVLVLGADKWHQIQDPAWYGGDPAERDRVIGGLPTVAVVPRDGLDVPAAIRLDVPDGTTVDVSSTRARNGDLDLMTPAARRFAHRSGAWIDVERFERWLASPDADR